VTRPLAIVALVLATAVVPAAPVPKSLKQRDDGKAILGKWRGDVLPQNRPGGNNQYTFRFGDDGTCGITSGPNAQESPAEYTLDASQSPKRMKWLNGPQKTEWRCVYELSGDTLRVGFVHPGTDIPPDVAARPGVTVYELKRITDDK
jgi:uncharacterized protein (TIGR03067 family)